MAKLIYIGGYGRSGSTLLEYLLASHPDIVACGEVARHLRNFSRKAACTCGRRVRYCPVWGPFRHKKGNPTQATHEQLSLALLDQVAGTYSVMVDSSKTAWGSALLPFHLYRQLGEDFLLVHVVRDARGVSWSAMRTQLTHKKAYRNFHPFLRALQAAVGWTFANLPCEVFGWRHPECYLRIRYEDLTSSPREVVDPIFQHVALEAPPSLEAREVYGNRHQLYGNAMRFRPLSPTSLREDAAWRSEMPKFYRGLIGSLCWPLLRSYGYHLAARETRGHSNHLKRRVS